MCEIVQHLKRVLDQFPDDTADVPTLEDLRQISEGVTKYKLAHGLHAISRNLDNTEHATIAKTVIPKGGYFPPHVHNSPVRYETIFILEGILIMTIGRERMTLTQYDQISITQNVKHDAYAKEDVTLIAITIPKDNGFPK